MHVSRRAAILLGSGTTVTAFAALGGADTSYSASLAASTPTARVGSRPVPKGAVVTTPGHARAALAKVPRGGTLVLRGGTYTEALGTIRKNVTIQPYPGETVWLDGRHSLPTAFIADAVVNLHDLGIRNYAPSRTDWLRAMVFYGGHSGGSVVQDCTFEGSRMASLQFAVPLTITGNVFRDNGWSGVMGTTANGLVFTDNTITGMNRDHHPAEPETAGIKLTRSANVVMKRNTVTDVPGAYGIWFDVSSTNAHVIGNHVDGRSVGGRAAMKQAAEFELYEGGVVAGNTFTGAASAGLRLIDAGHLRVWNNDLRGNPIGLWIQQDARKNSGRDRANLRPAVAPWLALGNEICNNTFDGHSQLWAYDSGRKEYAGADMVGRVAGNWFAPAPSSSMAIRLGRRGTSASDSLNAAQLRAALGSRGGPNYQGTTAASAASGRVPVPSDIAALMK